jgi:hypothetical protein
MMWLSIHAAVQAQLDALVLSHKRAKWEAAAAADTQEQQLLDTRCQLLCDGTRPLRDPCSAAAGGVTSSVPLFWLTALMAADDGAGLVAHRYWASWARNTLGGA